MKKVLIVGAGKGGSALLKMFHETKLMDVVAVVDRNHDAPGISIAREMGIQTSNNWRDVLTEHIDIIVEVTGDDHVFTALRQASPAHTVVIPGDIAYIIAQLVEEKEQLIATLKTATTKHDLIFNSTHDGMIVIDERGYVTHVNPSAEKMIGKTKKEVVGTHILHVIPASGLPRVLQTREVELNQELLLENGKK